MLTITLQGEEAKAYLAYLHTQSTSTRVSSSVTADIKAPLETVSTDPIDKSWRARIIAQIIPERRNGSLWTNQERNFIKNAVNKTDKHYYSISTLAIYTGRSKGAITSEAIRQGYETSNDFIIHPNNQLTQR